MIPVPMAPKRRLSHIGDGNRPRMVDVGGKAVTRRTAHAVAVVVLPRALARMLQGGEIDGPKGPIFQAATLAGIMGAKRTADLIPLCHPLPLDNCSIEIKPQSPKKDGSVEVEVHCRARTRARTGVEMEALTAVQVGLLTIYDMVKAIDRGMVMENIRVLEKHGGKSGSWTATSGR